MSASPPPPKKRKWLGLSVSQVLWLAYPVSLYCCSICLESPADHFVQVDSSKTSKDQRARMYMYHACRTRGAGKRDTYKGRFKRTHFKTDGREN